uniref:Tc1-like transposase DDE domain-containing protein n=1 Tax=Lepeophtheirus salmonis TaxID=72036 RepID=A0A0K2U2Y6_LEPSM
MIFEGIASNGSVIPVSSLSKRRGWVSAGTGNSCLTNGVEFLFQQDSAPSHKARKTLKMFKEEKVSFSHPHTWPSNSPYMNPMDYFF